METNPLCPHPFCHTCSHSRFPLSLRAAQCKSWPSQELLKAFFPLPSFLQLLEGKQQPHSPFCAPGLGSWSLPRLVGSRGALSHAWRAGTASQQALSSSCCWMSMERAPHPAQGCRGGGICRAEPWTARGNWVWGLGPSRGDGAGQGIGDQPRRGELGQPELRLEGTKCSTECHWVHQETKIRACSFRNENPQPCSP